MNNKNYILYLTFALVGFVAIGACTKIPALSDQPFSVDIKSVQSRAVWADVIPENNDFSYSFGTVSVQDYEQKYHNDDALIQDKDSQDKQFWEENLKDRISFRDAFLYTGAYFVKDSDLEPETDYYIYVFPYDQNDNPIGKVVKQRFRTSSYNPSDINFNVTVQGSVISVTPSNNDTYYFDYDTVESISEDFGNDPLLFYSVLVYKYEEYGFMSELTTSGPSESDMADYFTLTPGQQFYMIGSGYDNGVNSPYRIYKITYAGPDIPGTVEVIEQ